MSSTRSAGTLSTRAVRNCSLAPSIQCRSSITSTWGRCAAAELEEEARLADARLADKEGNLPLSCPRALEGVEEQVHLALAPHEWREAAVGLHLEARARLVRGDNLPRGDGFGLALEVKIAERPRLEVAADETMGRLRDRHASRLAGLLQTRCHVGRISHGRVV